MHPQSKTELQRIGWFWLHIALAFLLITVGTSALCVLALYWGLGLSFGVTHTANTAIQFLEAIGIYRWAKRPPPTMEDL